MAKRLGFIGIILHDRKKSAEAVNKILSDYGDLVVGRMGIPHARKDCSVIAVIVDATTDQIGALTGRLGKVAGISVKSACAKE